MLHKTDNYKFLNRGQKMTNNANCKTKNTMHDA